MCSFVVPPPPVAGSRFTPGDAAWPALGPAHHLRPNTLARPEVEVLEVAA